MRGPGENEAIGSRLGEICVMSVMPAACSACQVWSVGTITRSGLCRPPGSGGLTGVAWANPDAGESPASDSVPIAVESIWAAATSDAVSSRTITAAKNSPTLR